MLKFRKIVLVALGFMLGSLSIQAQVMDNPPLDGVYDKIHNANQGARSLYAHEGSRCYVDKKNMAYT